MAFEIYKATRNSDLTEGRGHPRTIALFAREDDAVEAVKGWGVMGVGDGEVYASTVYTSVDVVRHGGVKTLLEAIETSDRKVYGYRKRWDGKWDYGYVDLRDKPDSDPEFAEYMRLKRKFEGE